MQKEKTPLEVYNDLGKNVYSLFKVLANEDSYIKLKNRLELAYYMNGIREEYKELLKDKSLSVEDRAYYFFYVNRSSFNGVGGFSRTMLVRRNMSKSTSDYLSAIDRLPELHNRLSSVIIDNADIFDLLNRYNKNNVFIYLDPPYVKSTRSSSTNYEVEMGEEEHVKLVNTLLCSESKILISGYDHEIYKPLSKNWFKLDFKSPNSNSQRTETLWKNY